MNTLEKIILSPIAQQYFWIGIYRRKGNKAVRVGFQGPMPPCHEFEFGTGNVGLVASKGIRKVIADVSTDPQYSMCFIQTASEIVEPIFFENELLGVIDVESDQKNFFTQDKISDIQELARLAAPLLVGTDGPNGDAILARNLRLLQWLQNARDLEPEICNWIGIYFKESFLNNNTSTDLILGPYLGLSTEHVRIPLDKGFCGMAMRENRIVNIADVTADARHIACSLTTRSELVIPLKDAMGRTVAELDIDSDRINAFSQRAESNFIAHAETFAAVLQ
jgi:L-methionine (R)-S-oxide reductase